MLLFKMQYFYALKKSLLIYFMKMSDLSSGGRDLLGADLIEGRNEKYHRINRTNWREIKERLRKAGNWACQRQVGPA